MWYTSVKAKMEKNPTEKYPGKNGHERLVLLAEGDLALRERFYDVLTQHGFSVITVDSGERALEMLKHERPSVILSDLKLHDMSGFELAVRIHLHDGRMPVLLIGHRQEGGVDPRDTHEVQAILPDAVPDPVLVREVEYWANAPGTPHCQWKPGKVLIIDDEPKIVHVLEEFLEAHGLTVLTAGSGEQALQVLDSFAPQVVLLDVKLPGMDGLLTLKKIKTQRPEATVIVISGLEDERVMAQALALGALDYLKKPFDYASLETALLGRFTFEP